MTVVLTMAGAGSRFARAGYRQPKHAIVFRGHTLLEWSLASLLRFRDQRLVVVAQPLDGVAETVQRTASALGFDTPTVVYTTGLTRGQAESASLVADAIAPDEPFIVYNTDTYVRPGALEPSSITGDGWIPCFSAAGDKWSFVELDNTGAATRVAEKVRISDHCSIGLYYFSSFGLFRQAYEAYRPPDDAELYVAPLYNELIAAGRRVEIQRLAVSDVSVLGTPEDLDRVPSELEFPSLPTITSE